MGTGGTLTLIHRRFPHQTKDFGGKSVAIMHFSDLESFCSVVSSAGKYFRGEKPGPALWRPQEPPALQEARAREVLRVHCHHREITLLSPSTLLWGTTLSLSLAASPRAWGTRCYRAQERQQPVPIPAGLPLAPARTGCPNHRCRCHRESFERVPTCSSSSLFSSRKS